MKILELKKISLKIELWDNQIIEIQDFTVIKRGVWLVAEKTIKLIPTENYPKKNALNFVFEEENKAPFAAEKEEK